MPRSRRTTTIRAASEPDPGCQAGGIRRHDRIGRVRRPRGSDRADRAGFGSYLGRLLDLDARDARIAVAVGMAAGIGAIFRAPLGGAVLGAELLYRDDVESDVLVPSFIATIIAYSIFGSVEGFSPIFGIQARFGFNNPAQLGWYALIGLACGAVGLLYINNFYGLMDRFAAWRIRAG